MRYNPVRGISTEGDAFGDGLGNVLYRSWALYERDVSASDYTGHFEVRLRDTAICHVAPQDRVIHVIQMVYARKVTRGFHQTRTPWT